MTSKTWRTLFFVALAILVVVGAVIAAKAIVGGQIEKEIALSINVTAAGDFEIAVDKTELNLKKGESGTITITNTASGGFDARIEFSISGLPENAYSFSVNPVNVGQTTVLTIDSTNLVTNTGYACTLTAIDI